MQTRNYASAARLTLAALSIAFAGFGDDAVAGGKTKYLGAPIFDIDKRKKTKHALTDWAQFGAYASVRYSGERNLRLDDDADDFSDKYSAYLGLTARIEPTDRLVGFAHLEAELTERETHKSGYTIDKIHKKEIVGAARISERSTVSAGRMRFSDALRWSTDASVDGVHYGFKGEDLTVDLAAFAGTYDDNGRYALAHVSRFSETDMLGGVAIVESDDGEERVHLASYWSDKVSDTLSYTMSAGVTLGDAANDQSFGVAADVRVIKQLSGHELKPQLTLGLAAASKGFKQTGVESHKTYDGGQTQFHRYGYVYQPELKNIAAATAALGLRPSRMFSVDFTAHAYAQTETMAGPQEARVSGETTGRSRFLGVEASVVGAWRPTKQSKAELGLSLFKPGSAYENRETAKQIYARFSYYF